MSEPLTVLPPEAPAPRVVMVPVERLMSVKEFAELEDMSTKAVYHGVNHDGWPCYRRGMNGGVIKFSVKHLMQIREMQAVAAGTTRAAPRRRTRRTKAAA